MATMKEINNIAITALSCRFQTNDCILSYKLLYQPVLINTVFFNISSHRNNKRAQGFATDQMGTCVSDETKCKISEALLLMFQSESVTLFIVMDGAKEQALCR